VRWSALWTCWDGFSDKLLIIDLPRPPSVLHILQLSQMLPLTMIPLLHGGLISSLRAYSRSACSAAR